MAPDSEFSVPTSKLPVRATPCGDLTIGAAASVVNEGGEAAFFVWRNYYGQGAVSVTVRVAAGGSATPGQDFSNPGSKDWQDVVLTWADGEMGPKYLPVLVAADGIAEQQLEALTLELVSPTGGARLAPRPRRPCRSLTHLHRRRHQSPSAGGGGGGSFGSLGALLLGLGGALRRRRIRNR